MQRWEWSVWIFVALAVACGFGSATLTAAAGWNPLAASAFTVVLLAVFGWTRRGREFVDVFGPAVAVAYAAFAGIAVLRSIELNSNIDWQTHAAPPHLTFLWVGGHLSNYWPAALVGGVAYALVLAIFVAVPASWLTRSGLDPQAVTRHERFAAVYRERLAGTTPPERPAGSPARSADAVS